MQSVDEKLVASGGSHRRQHEFQAEQLDVFDGPWDHLLRSRSEQDQVRGATMADAASGSPSYESPSFEVHSMTGRQRRITCRHVRTVRNASRSRAVRTLSA